MTDIQAPQHVRETVKQYDAFQKYCDMGAGRTLRDLAAQLQQDGIKRASARTLATWSRDLDWQRRVDAYDAEVAERDRQNAIEHDVRVREKRRKNRLKDQKLGRKVGRSILTHPATKKPAQVVVKGAFEKYEPGEISPRQYEVAINGLSKVGADERLDTAAPSARVDITTNGESLTIAALVRGALAIEEATQAPEST